MRGIKADLPGELYPYPRRVVTNAPTKSKSEPPRQRTRHWLRRDMGFSAVTGRLYRTPPPPRTTPP